MNQPTANQTALVAHIEAENVKTQEWLAAGAGRWAGMVTADVAHWAGYGITTVEQYEHHMAVETYIDVFKSINGIKPRWALASLADKPAAEVNAMIDKMVADEQYAEMGALEHEAHEINRVSTELNQPVEVLMRWGVV